MGGDELPECDALRSYVVSANDLWDIDEGDDARLELFDEIDIVELIGQDPDTIYGTLHYGGPWPQNTSSAGMTAWGDHEYVLNGATFNDDFHVFAIEWEANEIRWYVDGVHYQTQTDWYSTAAAYPAPFDQNFHFIANVAVGGNWPGSPNPTTPFPQQFQIDWVRVFQ